MVAVPNDVEVDGVRLAYQERGDGEAVLLLHPGFIANGMVPMLRAPELDGFRLIAYHRRGYGDSSRHRGQVSLARQATDAAMLLDRVGVRRAHVVGHSVGADVALQLAVSDPDRVGALVLLEPLLGFALSPQSAAYVGAAAAQALPRFAAGDHAGALDAWLSGAFGAGYREALQRALPDAWQMAVADAPAAFAGEVPSLQEWPFGPDHLGMVHSPTLSVVNSGTYWAGFKEMHDMLLTRIPGCEGAVVPVSSHLLQITDPRPVAEQVAGFLRRHPLPD